MCGHISIFQGCRPGRANRLSTTSGMEQRQHPRIRVPMAVELTHPSIGTIHTSLRDISPGGVFVYLPRPSLNQGARVKLKATTLVAADPQPTPTVDMQVVRVTDDGLGLVFANKTAEHLWHSVQHWRDELTIGEDYFQVHQSALLYQEQRGVLIVQRHGRWLLPGHFLSVGLNAVDALRSSLLDNLGISLTSEPQCIYAGHHLAPGVPEAATYITIFADTLANTALDLPKGSQYTNSAWIISQRELTETTFADPLHNTLIEAHLRDQGVEAD